MGRSFLVPSASRTAVTGLTACWRDVRHRRMLRLTIFIEAPLFERVRQYPPRPLIRLRTCRKRSERTVRRHLPAPSPRRPWKPSPPRSGAWTAPLRCLRLRSEVTSPGGAGLDDEFLAEHAQCSLDAVHGGAVARVEHAAHGLLVHAESLGEDHARQAAFAKREGEGGLGCGAGGDGDMMFYGASCARYRDTLGVVDASRNASSRASAASAKAWVSWHRRSGTPADRGTRR